VHGFSGGGVVVKEKKEGKKRKLHADGGKKVSSISNATGATNLAAEAAKVVKEVSGHGGTFRTDANSNRVCNCTAKRKLNICFSVQEAAELQGQGPTV
jgi:hypothetical protein